MAVPILSTRLFSFPKSLAILLLTFPFLYNGIFIEVKEMRLGIRGRRYFWYLVKTTKHQNGN